MTDFCNHVRETSAGLWTAVQELPFNRELAAGTLDPARFRFYIVQDALYLEQYARILLLAAARGPDSSILRLFAQGALEAVAVEQALHADYFKRFGLNPAAAEPTPDCLGYTSFLLATAYHEPWEVLTAALLPCFWLYWDVGTAIARVSPPDNPYKAWIDTYADEAFGAAVQAVISATDQAAEHASAACRGAMATAFLRSCRFEYLFWDSAYQRRGWPLQAQSPL
jgi:thiaminase/transcriptional activator TenA